MDIISEAAFRQLAEGTGQRCISIYLPTHRKGHQVLEEHDQKHFRRQLKKISDQLAGQADVDALLKPAHDLLENDEFWRHQQEGLAVFVADNFFETYRLPVAVQPFELISQRFYVKPLLPLLDTPRFLLLRISKKVAELFEANAFSIQKISQDGQMPEGIEEVLQYYEFPQDLQVRTQSGGGVKFHGNENETKQQDAILQEYFRNVDDAVMKLISGRTEPLVLASVAYLQPLYHSRNTYAHLHEKGLTGNHDDTAPEVLREAAWPLVAPTFEKTYQSRVEEFNNLIETDRVSIDPPHILKQAAAGLVKTLFVDQREHLWGRFDADALRADVHRDFQPHDEDLLDRAAVLAQRNGGEVFVRTDLSPLAREVPIAATFY